uniref:Uncharacterized protein n=1 Tax=Triticum urartu TaxID=4572 RepID=A0A8R7TTG2_TRIUA
MNKRHNAEKEAPRCFPPAPIYPVDKDEDPYQNERRYEEFCEARMKLPLGYELCTVCFFEEPWRHGNAVVRSGNMLYHFNCHNTPGVKCGEELCTVP